MAVTRNQTPHSGAILNVSKFTATADNDRIMAAGTAKLVLGATFTGSVTALNIDAGSDITAYPFSVTTAQNVDVTASGSGTVELVWVDLPTYTSGVSDNQLTSPVT